MPQSITLRDKIISHFRANPGVTPFWTTLGTTYHEGHPVFQALRAEGVLVERTVPSKSGKSMVKKLFLADGQ